MAGRFQTLRGFRDLLPGETEHWQRFEAVTRDVLGRYGFREIRVPHLESTALFARSVGEATDIVGKEMFTFDLGDDSVSLRPELTAQVCRAYVQHGLDRSGSNRLFYVGPAFRKERPQKGRLRQFHQVGIEVFGEAAPETDVEVLAAALDLVHALGVQGARLLLNSIGDKDSRAVYRRALVAALEPRASELCGDCRDRLRRNPLRVLDCKVESCRRITADAPKITEFLSESSAEHYAAVRRGLDRLGQEYEEDPRLVRGLDYYVQTTFEIRADGLGAQDTVLGGGRYDGLVAELGGRETPGLGWAAGLERLMLAAGLEGREAKPRLDLYYVTLGPQARDRALCEVQRLRAAGLAVGWDTAGHGLGGQMKRAGRSGARFALLVGDDELTRGVVGIKDLQSGEQRESPATVDAILEMVRRGERQ